MWPGPPPFVWGGVSAMCWAVFGCLWAWGHVLASCQGDRPLAGSAYSSLWFSGTLGGCERPDFQLVGGLLYLPTRIINYILWQRHRYSRSHTIRRSLICVFVHFHIFLFQVLYVFFLFLFFPYFLTVAETLCFFICALSFYYIFSYFLPHLSAYTLVLLHIYCKNWNKSNGNE